MGICFLDRQFWFRELMDIERGELPPKKESNEVILIPLDSEAEEEEEIEEDEKAISLDSI